MDVTWRTIVAIGLISVLVTSYEYEYDSNYEIPADCRSCDKVKCPILVYCAGIKMRDRCGCCEWCSSDLFQPHAAPRAFPVSGTSLQAQPQVEPEEDQLDSKPDPCDQVKCSKFKVCMVNSQGLPLCTCPSINICEPGRKKNKLSQEMVVCGSDGVTYKSRCHMRIANCMNRRRIKRAHKGACTEADIKPEVNNSETGLLETGPFKEDDISERERQKAIERANRKRLKRKRRKEKKEKRRRREREKKEKKEKKTKKNKRNRRKRRNNLYPRSYGYYYLLGKKTRWGTNQVRRNRAM